MRAAGFCGSGELCHQDSAFNRKYHSFGRLGKQPVPSGKIGLRVYMCTAPSSGQPGTCVISTASQQGGEACGEECALSCSSQTFWDSLDCSPPGSSVREVLRGVGCHFLLQGIFPTWGSNPCLLRWQADSLPLTQLDSPMLWSRSPLMG